MIQDKTQHIEFVTELSALLKKYNAETYTINNQHNEVKLYISVNDNSIEFPEMYGINQFNIEHLILPKLKQN